MRGVYGQILNVVADDEFRVDDRHFVVIVKQNCISIAMFDVFVEGQVWAFANSMSTSHFIVIGGWCLLNDLSKHLQLSSP